eukprot:CCRYP_004607-RA/>CCRYP_004607-RA protein AED:0.43 eAED:0.97 QI:0/0/0/1/0/0/3/0/532
MSSVKAFPEGLKWIECERGIGGKNSPVRYIPEQDPLQDALEKTKKTTYFKLTLPNTLDAEIAEEEYTQLRNSKKKKKGNKGDAPGTTAEAVPAALAEAKALYNKALKALEAVKRAVTTAGAKPFELYGNLLSDEARQPWEKIIKAQGTRAPWEDIKGVPHTETPTKTPTKTWDSFHMCVMFHLLQVFRHDAGEALKYYITNTSPTGSRYLNSYLETLPCLYYSPKANQATKKVLPLDDADLATHLLRMCPAKWQTQYDLTKNTTPVSTRALLLVLENIENNAELDAKPSSTNKANGADHKRKMESIDSRIPKKPKKVGWTDNHCVLCKKHGGPHKSHNTRDCRRYNKDGTPTKKNGGAGKPHSKERKPEGANFTQIVWAELKNALRKKSSKRKKRRANDSESHSDSDKSSGMHGSDRTGELHTCKKRKLNTAIDSYTTPSPSKAIHTNKSKINELTVTKEKTSKKSCSKTKTSELKIRDNLETTTSNISKNLTAKKQKPLRILLRLPVQTIVSSNQNKTLHPTPRTASVLRH